MPGETCYDRLRPAEVVAAREACPVAWLPLGTLEWHGPHLPAGTDLLLAHALAVRAARSAGGLVFPPLAFGEPRLEGLMEANASDRQAIVAAMALPAENFEPAAWRTGPQDQFELYQRLLLHALNQMQTLGFRLTVLLCGHFPLVDHAQAACCLFHQMRWDNRRDRMLTWAFSWPQMLSPPMQELGDHAGCGETSLALALMPDLVDLARLPGNPDECPPGVLTRRPVAHAEPALGERMAGMIVEGASAAVRDRLARPQAYRAHGWSSAIMPG